MTLEDRFSELCHLVFSMLGGVLRLDIKQKAHNA